MNTILLRPAVAYWWPAVFPTTPRQQSMSRQLPLTRTTPRSRSRRDLLRDEVEEGGAGARHERVGHAVLALLHSVVAAALEDHLMGTRRRMGAMWHDQQKSSTVGFR